MTLPLASLARFDRWQRRIDFRATLRRAKTLGGAALIVMGLIAAPSIVDLARRGPFAVADASPSQVLGALLLAHVAIALAFAAMVWVSIPTGLVLRFQHAPLRAHGAVLPVALLHEVVVVGIGRSALLALALLYGLHWRLLGTVIASPIEWAAHFALVLMTLASIGGFLFARARRTILRAPDPRHRAMLANKRGVFGALFALLGGFAGQILLAQKAPWVLERIGAAAAEGVVFVVPPLHAVTAPSWLPALAWLLVGSFSTVALWRAAARSASGWVTDLPVDHQSAASFTMARLHSLIFGRGTVRRASAFAAKDLLLPLLRVPARHFLQQWFAFATVAMIPILLRIAVPGARETAAPVLFPVLAALYALILAPLATLHLLGMEGRRIGLLVPIVPARLLLVLKGAPALVFVMLHALAGALLLLVLGTALAYANVPVVGTLAAALIGGAVAAALGVAIGFLFPDFERRSVANPGASAAGRFGFMAVASFALAIFAILQAMGQAGLHRSVLGASLGILVALVAAVTAALGFAGIKRLSRLEIS